LWSVGSESTRKTQVKLVGLQVGFGFRGAIALKNFREY
jgi:hypothetical protein